MKFKFHTLHPSVQMLTPPDHLDRSQLTHNDLDFQGIDLPKVLIVDLRGTLSMDCDGLAWLVNLQILMIVTKKTLILINPAAAALDLLRQAGIENRFQIASGPDMVREDLESRHPDLFGTRIVPAH